MESIILFELESVYRPHDVVIIKSILEKHYINDKQYSLQYVDNYLYSSVKSFNILLESKYWEESKVGKFDGKKVDKDIRSSENISVKLDISCENLIIENMKRLLPIKYRNIIDNEKYIRNDYTALKYNIGGKFLIHRDTKISNCHFGTILIFPPSNLSPHKGGILRICDENGEWHEFDSSNMRNWTAVIFNPLLEHEVTEIEFGTRIVFKKECLLNEDLFELLNNNDNLKSKNIELKTDIVDNENKEDERLTYLKKRKLDIVDLLTIMEVNFSMKDNKFEFDYINYDNQFEKLTKLVSSLSVDNLPTINRPDLTFNNVETDRIMKEIENSDEKIIILILKNYYDNANIEWLYQQDYDLYKSINEKYKDSYISNFEEKYVNGDLSEYEGIGRYLKRSDDWFSSSLKYPINVIRLGEGKRRSTIEEYNDSDYDTVQWYSITCIVINKV